MTGTWQKKRRAKKHPSQLTEHDIGNSGNGSTNTQNSKEGTFREPLPYGNPTTKEPIDSH